MMCADRVIFTCREMDSGNIFIRLFVYCGTLRYFVVSRTQYRPTSLYCHYIQSQIIAARWRRYYTDVLVRKHN